MQIVRIVDLSYLNILSGCHNGPSMTRIVKRFEVSASPERVFEAVSVPEKWPRWTAFVQAASSRGPKTHWVYNMGGMKVEADTEVTEIQENKIYSFRQTSGFLKRGEGRFLILPSKKGSIVTWTNEYELPYSYLGKLMDKLKARKQFEEGMDKSIKNLTGMLER